MIQVKVKRSAEADIDSAREWYDLQSPGLGNQFLDEMQAALVRLAEFPFAAVEVEPGARRILTNRFPYGIIYVMEEDAAYVVAVVHLHRDPEVWRQRL